MTIWKDKKIVPMGDMQIWSALDDKTASAAASSVTDFSGNNRTLTAESSQPAYSTDILNGNGGVYFDGTKNPLAANVATHLKHIFMLASYDDETFTANEGLLSGIASLPILVGETAGSTKFIDNVYPNFRYRIMDVLLPNSNQLAPVGGRVAVIEVQFDSGFFLDGVQIGQDRNLTARKWKGYFFELLGYSSIKDDYDRHAVYQYFARKYHVWQQSLEGLNIFPFPANHSRSKSIGRTFFSSKPYSGPTKKLLRGDRFATVEANFDRRRESEFSAAAAFHAEHHGLKDFVFRDYKYFPARDMTCEFTSDLQDSGGDDVSRLFNYGFTAKGTATPEEPANSYGVAILDDEDIFLVDG